MQYVLIQINGHPLQEPIRAKYCISFFCRFKGLMFKHTIKKYEGILLVEASDSRINTAIHMFFMRFDIAAIWINSSFEIVDKQYAHRWAPSYIPAKPARYILETHPSHLSDFNIGDQVTFTYE